MSGDAQAAAVGPTVALVSAGTVFKLMYRDGSGTFHADWPRERIDDALADSGGLVWVDILGPEEQASPLLRDWLCRHFPFHHLAVEDALAQSHIAKIDDWGDYLYLVFHVAAFEPNSDKLDLHELDFFLGPNYLITYHTAALEILDRDRASIIRDPRDRLRNGPDHLLYRFLELAIDQSLGAIEHLDEKIDQIQNAVIEHASPKSLRAIFRLKRAGLVLHKALSPQREVLTRLARDPFKPVQAKHRVYFRDLYDHVVRIHDISESLRDLIAGAVETYLSVVSNRTNDIMKALTIVTVMFLPMTFLVGFFGMNFFGETLAFTNPMPRALLFWASTAIMAISPGFIWIYARRRKWF